MGQLDDYVRKLAIVSASDLLLSGGRLPLYRALDGLSPLPGEGMLPEAELREELERLLSPDEWQQLGDEQQVSFSAELAEGLRVRGACHQAAHGLTLRLSLLGAQGDSVHDLELPTALAQLPDAEAGLIIVTGPRGSGKTTFVARVLSEIAAVRPVYIATSENPVEYRLRGTSSVIVQRSVGQHCPSHASALEAAIASEAQVIACSELHAAGAAELMIEAACAGALAIGELPGASVVRTLEQLQLAEPSAARVQWQADVADSLHAVVALDLVPKKDGGQVWAAEILLATRNVCGLIRDGKLSMLAGLLDRESGMQSMDRCLLDLATRGIIDGREAYARASDKRVLSAWA
ncbi:MAG: ATPase, T2SS/T4P/T4SS family [Polyangiales bacterium]